VHLYLSTRQLVQLYLSTRQLVHLYLSTRQLVHLYLSTRQLVHLYLSTDRERPIDVPAGNETEMCGNTIANEGQFSAHAQWHVG
jgi:hypothetical protein